MKDRRKIGRAFSMIYQLGWCIVMPELLCIIIATWTEEQFGVSIMIPMIILGIVAGLRNAWVLLKDVIK